MDGRCFQAHAVVRKKKKRKNPLTIEEKYSALKQRATHQGCWQAGDRSQAVFQECYLQGASLGRWAGILPNGEGTLKGGKTARSSMSPPPPATTGVKIELIAFPQPRILSLTSGCWACNPSQSLSLPSQLHRRLLTRGSSPRERIRPGRQGRQEGTPTTRNLQRGSMAPVLTVVRPM